MSQPQHQLNATPPQRSVTFLVRLIHGPLLYPRTTSFMRTAAFSIEGAIAKNQAMNTDVLVIGLAVIPDDFAVPYGEKKSENSSRQQNRTSTTSQE